MNGRHAPPMLPWDMPDEEVERIQKRALNALLVPEVAEVMTVEQAQNYRNDSVVFTITARVEMSNEVLRRNIPQRESLTLAQMQEHITTAASTLRQAEDIDRANDSAPDVGAPKGGATNV